MRASWGCLAALALAPVAACGLFGPRGDRVSAPAAPVALTDVNSPWDDYNAAKPRNWQGFIFSSNRGSSDRASSDRASNERTFDVWYDEVAWSEAPHATLEARPFSPETMSEANELGPLIIDAKSFTGVGGLDVLVLASDRPGGKGGLDLYWAADCSRNGPCRGALQALDGLNSAGNDAYLSLPFAEGRVLFASDRAGSGYDLYEARWAPRTPLTEAPSSLRVVPELSGEGDDTAPYVVTRKDGIVELVFVSSRAGGQGGRDLYCARLEGGAWRAPRNLGAGINSAADEFRPSVFEVSGSEFLLFSSDRAGGKGGFDLYTVRYAGCEPQRDSR